jgi:hypothetical protein
MHATMPTSPSDRVHVLAALALEVSAAATEAPPKALSQPDAGALADLVARDLAAFHPDVAQLDLVTVGAHYDAVELLRPGWPLFRELEQLAARAPRAGIDGARIVAFGAHHGTLPGALTPAAEHASGPMRLVPLLLAGAPDSVATVGDAFESDLLERGMAGAATALAAQDGFGLRVEHARYLTLHDLMAMVSMHYEHAGIAPFGRSWRGRCWRRRAAPRSGPLEPAVPRSGGECRAGGSTPAFPPCSSPAAPY